MLRTGKVWAIQKVGCQGNRAGLSGLSRKRVLLGRWKQRGRDVNCRRPCCQASFSGATPRHALLSAWALASERSYKALFFCHRRGGRDKAPLILGQQSVTDTWLERPHTPKPKDSGLCSLCGSKASGSPGPRLCLCPSGCPFLLLGRGFLPVGVGSAGARPLVLRPSSILL